MSAGRWAELLVESSRREARQQAVNHSNMAQLLLGDTMTVLGRPVRVTGLEWLDGEPPDWREFMRQMVRP